MNKKLYWIIGVILIVALGFGGYALMMHSQNAPMNSQSVTTYPTAAPSQSGGSGLMNTDTSNQQLDQDVQDVQSSMDKLNADQAQTDQAVSNQSSDTLPTQ